MPHLSPPNLAVGLGAHYSHRRISVTARKVVYRPSRKRSLEGLDEPVIRGFSRPREVQGNTPRTGPKVQLLRDELRSQINTDRLWKSVFTFACAIMRTCLGLPIKTQST